MIPPDIRSKRAQFTQTGAQSQRSSRPEQVVLDRDGLDLVHQDVGRPLTGVLQVLQHLTDLIAINVVACDVGNL